MIVYTFYGQISKSWCKNILSLIMHQNINAAQDEAHQKHNIIAKVFSTGLDNLQEGETYVDSIMTKTANTETAKLTNNLYLLSMITSAATMIGFLGTIIGLIKAFMKIAQTTDQITPQLLANGIYESMVTTAVGLIVGVISDIAYRIFISKYHKKCNDLEIYCNDLTKLIHMINTTNFKKE